MAISKDNDRLTIIISKDSKDKLAELAKEDGRSLSSYITNILQEHLDEVNKNKIHPMWEIEGSEPYQGEQQSMLNSNNWIEDEVEVSIHKHTKSLIDDIVYKKLYKILSQTYETKYTYSSKKVNDISDLIKRRDSTEISMDELEDD